MGKLTKRTIEALAPREIDFMVWDQDVPGFGVRVMPSGRKSFVLQYRAGRRSRRMVLGYVNVVTPEQARTLASSTSPRSGRASIRSPSATAAATR
jgi:Arm DNA-binding domain